MESRSVKIFDLAQAPLEIREGDEFAALRPADGDPDAVLMVVVVGQYEPRTDGAGDEIDSSEVTYSEYCLHLWLLESGAKRGEPVLLRWSDAGI